MRQVLFGITNLFLLVGFVCFVFVVIDAFKDELWKGLLCICCFFYWVYYALVEFEHDYKWPIALGGIIAPGIAAAIFGMIH